MILKLDNSKLYKKLNNNDKLEYKRLFKAVDKIENSEDLIDAIFKYKKTLKRKSNKIDHLKKTYENLHYYSYKENGDINNFYPKLLASKILKKVEIINIDGNFENNLVYHGGVYRKRFDLPLDKRLDTNIYNSLSMKDPKVVSNLRNTLKCLMEESRLNSSLVNTNTNYINFQNGLLNTSTWELNEHDSKIYNTIQVKTNYIKSKNNIENTKFCKYLNTVLSDDIIPVIQELLGYILSNEISLQKFFIFLGTGSNGKTVLLNIINSFFSDDFTTSAELKDLIKPEFVANLYNKKINTCGDISNEYISNTGLIKQLTGEDLITARPLYSNPITFRNIAKMIFSANKMPNTSDKTYAFLRRLIIIPFNRTFSEDEKDRHLSKNIIKNEKEQIAAWAIEGLKRLKENNFTLTESKSINESLKKYEISNNNIKEFIFTYCIINKKDNNIYIPKREIQELYKNWCIDTELKPLGPKFINETLSNLGLAEKNTTKYNGRYWENIKWNENILEFLENTKNNYSLKGSLKYNNEKEDYSQQDFFDGLPENDNDLPLPD